MAMKVCPAFPKTPVSLGLTIRFFSVISSILILGVVPLCRGTVGVFYSPRRPGWYYHWITYESWYSIKQRNRTFFFFVTLTCFFLFYSSFYPFILGRERASLSFILFSVFFFFAFLHFFTFYLFSILSFPASATIFILSWNHISVCKQMINIKKNYKYWMTLLETISLCANK